jgi:hypothetical protein
MCIVLRSLSLRIRLIDLRSSELRYAAEFLQHLLRAAKLFLGQRPALARNRLVLPLQLPFVILANR